MQRYRLVKEFYSKPVLAPPLILIAHVYILIRYIYRRHNPRDLYEFGLGQ